MTGHERLCQRSCNTCLTNQHRRTAEIADFVEICADKWYNSPGVFDTDRLDFVMRDGLASGLIDKTGDVDRIIKMYCLCENPKADDLKDKFVFLPSVQCLNDVQQILLDRYRIYKFLVNHHKVKKMDYILQKAMTLLMEEECGTDSGETGAALDLKRMSDMVRVTARVLDTQLNSDNVMRTKYQFAQLTENWAYSILNKKYIDLLISQDRRLKTLRLLLDEIFTGRKVFESLWKREHEFCDFVTELNEKIKLSAEVNKALMDKIESMKDLNKGQLILKDIRETDENLGKLAIRYLNVCCAGWQKDVEGLLSDDSLIVLIQTVKTETGITDLFLVDLKNHQNKYEFNEKISKVYDYLCLDSDSSTKFYVYYADIGQNHNKTQISNMLTDQIIEYIKKQTLSNAKTGNDNN